MNSKLNVAFEIYLEKSVVLNVIWCITYFDNFTGPMRLPIFPKQDDLLAKSHIFITNFHTIDLSHLFLYFSFFFFSITENDNNLLILIEREGEGDTKTFPCYIHLHLISSGTCLLIKQTNVGILFR